MNVTFSTMKELMAFKVGQYVYMYLGKDSVSKFSSKTTYNDHEHGLSGTTISIFVFDFRGLCAIKQSFIDTGTMMWHFRIFGSKVAESKISVPPRGAFCFFTLMGSPALR
jgi:hypothetical protein